MRARILVAVCWMWLMVTCNRQPADTHVEQSELHHSVMHNNRWTTDQATAQELKGLRNTIENFVQLNSRKFENLGAYQEFGNLLQLHIDRTTTMCKLDPDSRKILCSELDKLKPEIETLQGTDMEKSKAAVSNVLQILSGIDSTFSYMN